MVEWSPDGRHVFFTGNADGPRSLYRVAADGTGKPELVFTRTEWWINDSTPRPDGSGVMMAAQDAGSHDLVFLPTGGQKPEPFLATPSEERRPAFSPKGAYLAYVSNDSERQEVYLRPFPGPGPKRQVSTDGGSFPHWSRDGKEIFYLSADYRMMAVRFTAAATPTVAAPVALFTVPPELRAVETTN